MSIHIRRVRLRIPGPDRNAGEAFARAFAGELAARSGGLTPSHIGALHLRMAGGRGGASDAAQAVAARLNRVRSKHA